MDSKNYLVIGVIGLLVISGLFLVSKGSFSNLTNPNTSNKVTTPQTAPNASVKGMTIVLNEQNNSGEIGVATFKETNGKVVVTLNMKGGPANLSQPTHIHVGKCPDIGVVKYPLTNVVNGKSETTLNVNMKTLLSQLPLGLNVHKSVAEAKIYVACGDLTPQ